MSAVTAAAMAPCVIAAGHLAGPKHYRGVEFRASYKTKSTRVTMRRVGHVCRAASRDDDYDEDRYLGEIERARGGDYASAAAVFVEAFFLGRKSKAASAITKGELAYLNGAQKKDMLARYNQRGLCAMFVVKDAGGRGTVVGCVGAEVQTFVGTRGTTPLRRAGDEAAGTPVDRPVIANLATAPSARRRGLAKKLMGAMEEQCVEWGFEEAVLIVEASNSKAMGLYKKLGYRGIGSEATTPSLMVSDEGKVVEATVKTVFMRKSLKGGLQGSLENVDLGGVVGVSVAAALAAKVVAEGGVNGILGSFGM